MSNVDYNGYPVNLTFGFSIKGIKAFSRNTIIVYGHYDFVPSILYSINGGDSYKLVFNSVYDVWSLTGINDMIFPENDNIGYAVDADRILKTTDFGLTWNIIRIDPGSGFNNLQAIDNNHVFVIGDASGSSSNKMLKTSNGGLSWQTVSFPGPSGSYILCANFLASGTGWLNTGKDHTRYFYKTTDGGNSWVLINDAEVTSFLCSKMKFIDEHTGYALSGQNTVSKTIDGGAIWEPLSRE